ncbi:helix-turn-helix domain-containing protein [Comamonas sp. lk]|uniref:helix-turn-helix domain-containing protein n=1 Tax=Comamonas sp. lk TaxID=2201272 RepID=UPI000EB418DC|nr:helix-turn-helix domain-containing protein [Comamonas sp. lk]
MSDGVVDEVNMQSEEKESAPVTAGAMLRQAREAARMQLPSMAATLKVPQQKLQALEDDDYAAFSDHVFMRALAMGMCRSLQLDPAPVLALLPRTQLKSLSNGGPGINETVRERRSFKGAGTPLGGGENGTRKVVVGVVVLLVAAAAVYFVPMRQSADEASTVTQGTDSAAAAGAADAGSGVVLGAASISGEAPAGDAGASAAVAPVAAPAAPATTAAEAPAADASAAVLKLTATVQSWVKVKDANGKVVLEKTLAKDESVTADGTLPLSVIVGNAKGTKVTVRGEPLDIANTRDNVARFVVK